MTFWDFYGQHTVLGTIVVLAGFALGIALLMVVESVLLTWAQRPSADPGKR
jgi:hypothetical protein